MGQVGQWATVCLWRHPQRPRLQRRPPRRSCAQPPCSATHPHGSLHGDAGLADEAQVERPDALVLRDGQAGEAAVKEAARAGNELLGQHELLWGQGKAGR